MKTPAVITTAVLVLASLSACDVSTVEQPTASQSSRRASAPAGGIGGDGTYRVPIDVKPGTYRTNGPAEDGAGGNCYWARLKNTSGDIDAVIANNNTGGPATVTIKATDRAFETSGCLPWSKVK